MRSKLTLALVAGLIGVTALPAVCAASSSGVSLQAPSEIVGPLEAQARES
jgi:hypothetical protein